MKDNEPRVIAGIGEKRSNNGTQWYQQDRIYDNNVAIAVTTSFNPYYVEPMRGGNNFMEQEITSLDEAYKEYVEDGDIAKLLQKGIEYQENELPKLRIRKLTPRECFRLQGLKDEDIDLIMEHQTNASGYHLAGDSIEVTCLLAILGEVANKNWQEHFVPGEWWDNEKRYRSINE